MLAQFWPSSVKKTTENGSKWWFPTIIWKSIHTIQLKLVVYTCCVSVQKWFAFGWPWSNFGPLVATKLLKVSQNGGFQPLSEKVFMQSNSNLVCTLIGWVFIIHSLWATFAKFLALWWPQNDWKWWFPTITWKNHESINTIQFKLGECSELIHVWATLAKFWPSSTKWLKRVDSLLGHVGRILVL